MSSSDPAAQAAAVEALLRLAHISRFGHGAVESVGDIIPRESLGRVTAWLPQPLGAGPQPASAEFSDLSRDGGQAWSLRKAIGHLPDDTDFSPGLAGAAHALGPDSDPGDGDDALLRAAQAALNDEPPRTAEQAWREAVREELHAELHAAWQAEASATREAELQEARRGGYQDGYRDGLAALDSFKQSHAQQLTAQVGRLMLSLDSGLQGLEQQLADGVVRIATALARQVLRDELRSHPACVARVAQEAMAALLKSARQVVLVLHPDDHALVAQACAEQIAALNVQLVAAADIERGGCRIDSDVGSVDARIATRWAAAAGRLGPPPAWEDDRITPGTRNPGDDSDDRSRHADRTGVAADARPGSMDTAAAAAAEAEAGGPASPAAAATADPAPAP